MNIFIWLWCDGGRAGGGVEGGIPIKCKDKGAKKPHYRICFWLMFENRKWYLCSRIDENLYGLTHNVILVGVNFYPLPPPPSISVKQIVSYPVYKTIPRLLVKTISRRKEMEKARFSRIGILYQEIYQNAASWCYLKKFNYK